MQQNVLCEWGDIEVYDDSVELLPPPSYKKSKEVTKLTRRKHSKGKKPGGKVQSIKPLRKLVRKKKISVKYTIDSKKTARMSLMDKGLDNVSGYVKKSCYRLFGSSKDTKEDQEAINKNLKQNHGNETRKYICSESKENGHSIQTCIVYLHGGRSCVAPSDIIPVFFMILSESYETTAKADKKAADDVNDDIEVPVIIDGCFVHNLLMRNNNDVPVKRSWKKKTLAENAVVNNNKFINEL